MSDTDPNTPVADERPSDHDDTPPPTAVVTQSPGLNQPQRKEDSIVEAAKRRASATGLTRDILNWLKQRNTHFAL